jgi:hypothetical protein
MKNLGSLKGRAYFLPLYTGRSCFIATLCSKKMLCKLNTKFPFKTVYFLGARGLTTPTYIVFNYNTIGHTELTVYALYIHFYTIYLFIPNAIKM